MYKIIIHPNAETDLLEIYENPRAKGFVARVAALLEHAGVDPDRFFDLIDAQFECEDFDVKHVYSISRVLNYQVLRLKFLNLFSENSRYRMIYCYKPQSYQLHVLAFVHRDFDYDPKHPITHRIHRDYGEL